MTVTTVHGVGRPTAPVAHQLLVGPGDGYGDIALERLSLAPAVVPWRGARATGDRLLVVLAGHARVSVDPDVVASLAPDEVVHVAAGHEYRIEVLDGGPAGLLELLVLSVPGGH
ncbi:hypothetical protein [Pseudonocardia sp. HH130630-07]|uniref:hypothetical protein n=1 Tax=Pseudonocardia sp. HH130630-07 TaxID=1690815 RepID=UPI000814CDA1|nr:hypothetical protein [Pseudonocardia sp. HH130630-07]ANY05305.1 hypothetical protein AFB00_02115 [Pseudonocardia sp. HH130630-07]